MRNRRQVDDEPGAGPKCRTRWADPTGIDVSSPQGSFDWGAYRDKINFGICKVTEGLTITDPTVSTAN